jgi:hypothetical protein
MARVTPATSPLGAVWYAGPDTAWGEFWTMLHLPYTLMVLSFVVVGAAVSPQFSWTILGITLLAYFLGLGIGAHLLDQLPGMGSHYVRHWPAWALWVGGLLTIGAGIGIGIYGAYYLHSWGLLVLVAIQAVCAFGYPLAPVFKGYLHRDSVFAISWGALPFLTSFYVQTLSVTAGAIVLAATFAAVAVVEIKISRLARELRAEARTATPAQTGPAGPAAPFHRLDAALQALSAGTVLLGVGLLVSRLSGGL